MGGSALDTGAPGRRTTGESAITISCGNCGNSKPHYETRHISTLKTVTHSSPRASDKDWLLDALPQLLQVCAPRLWNWEMIICEAQQSTIALSTITQHVHLAMSALHAGCYENRRRFAEGSEMEGGDMLSDGEKRSDRRRFLEEKVKKEVTQR
ncbi:hypothetical protein F2P81_004284 [Scophthalmus maximus]|uniref:Uncharacterized protein n=1 Tax=Scophthalmus maximus TaxID=52904 RepID=A0A6A4T9A8_SCOMX|nr:hypothetical protein F2P81_004284 [Scophthalmus maximus]